MIKRQDIAFPCQALPGEPRLQRLLGLYPQSQKGLWMQRVKILAGELTAPQWQALGAVVRELTPDCPLHLTTRQDIELHDLSEQQVPIAQQRLAEAGMTGFGACGDTLRNVTVCPCAGLNADTADLAPLAWHVRRMLEADDQTYNLPRKFKISFSACSKACGRPFVNDLGFVLGRSRDGQWEFTVIGAGSLGPRPAAGIVLAEHLPPRDVPAMVRAGFAIFAGHGDRENRSKARLRHVRQRMGDEEFLSLLGRGLDEARRSVAPFEGELAPAADFPRHRTLHFTDGNLGADAADALAELIDAASGALRVRVGLDHRVEVFARADVPLDDLLTARPALADAARPQATILACPGKRWCSRAIIRTDRLADRLRRELGDRLPADLTISISGCPNGCSYSQAAPIGLSGCLTTTESGDKVEAFDLYVGGQLGCGPALADLRARRLPTDQAVQTVERLLGDSPSDAERGDGD